MSGEDWIDGGELWRPPTAAEWSCTPRKRLHDEYAMAALTGLLAARTFTGFDVEHVGAAWRYADAMMAERGK